MRRQHLPIYAAGEAEGLFFLAMRYVEGGDLGQLIEQRGRLEGEQALVLLGQVAMALDAAHAAGLLHRDVKPGNILVDGSRAWLADFGLAKHASTVNSLSRDNSFAGTVAYIAPEQIQGGDIDSRADVYSLGCVLFEALAGRRRSSATTIWRWCSRTCASRRHRCRCCGPTCPSRSTA